METSKTFWDKYASSFDAIYTQKNSFIQNSINKVFRKSMRMRFEKTMQAIPEEKTSIIDVGCGPGRYSASLALCEKRVIYAIDNSEQMILLARNHAKVLNVENRITFDVCNFIEYVPPQKFDYCIMMGFIEYFKNPELILQKSIELTKHKILVSFPKSGGLLAFQRKLRYKRRCFLRLYSYEDIKRLLTEVNIEHYTIERIKREFFLTININ
jgi:2-polyprenyl-3-methyl-5-hydroxy-6-metoxy-1,4-benzoquinol methylase